MRLFIMPELPTHLVQELNAGTVTLKHTIVNGIATVGNADKVSDVICRLVRYIRHSFCLSLSHVLILRCLPSLCLRLTR